MTIGPGSFTGLRVGVTTAKAFAYAVGGECLGIDSLEAIAEQAPAEAGRLISPAIEAQRGDVYAALYDAPRGRFTLPPAAGPAAGGRLVGNVPRRPAGDGIGSRRWRRGCRRRRASRHGLCGPRRRPRWDAWPIANTWPGTR